MLHDKTAVVYGGGGAIGGAVARELAREGARVFLAGRTLATLDRVARDIEAEGGTAEAAEVDALDARAVDEHAAAVAGAAGGIDIARPQRLLRLVVEVYGEERGLCARSAIGTSDLPLGMPVEVEAVVAVRAD